jgi:phage terminase small subunit
MQLKPPDHLKADGAALWTAISDEYSIDDAGGLALLTVAAECLDRLRGAQAELEASGTVVKDRYGAPKLHPAVQIEKDARNGFMAALKQLNLDLEPLQSRVGSPGLSAKIKSVK